MTNYPNLVSPDPEFRSTIEAALTQRERIAEVVKAAAKGARNIFLIGCGGSYNDFSAAAYRCDRSAKIPTFHFNSEEFNRRSPALLSADSVVLVASHNGTTKETIEAARHCRSVGARVIGFTKNETTPLAAECDDVFTYNSDRTILAPKQLLVGMVVTALLRETGAELDYAAIEQAYAAVPAAFEKAIEEAEANLHETAVAFGSEPLTYVLSAGPNQGAGYGFAMCYLMEMQWKHASWFNANEFLHGAFEVVQPDTPVLLFKGEDDTRAIIDRVETFLTKNTQRCRVVDSKDYSLPGVPASVRGEITPLLLSTLSRRLAEHYQAVTGHDLNDRRYMFKTTY
ncbi:SIS domain-containing protein (plasmid) [Agrobacterium tumefaciens]|uniref:SIS domain-containing protein n=3 Tax=Rhizobiaceae TaxID=82115 RepID=A0A2Z2PEN8_AGRTU|nr:SIS domain-containing protein [Agrobacterium tumefaciens]ASK40999.1 SIS domain-containing protein [Rhizobium rhizogenes]UXT61140.1 SIS domain-containing protein [Agrobacterium fabrum]ASK41169.1 SIS domain-containing protein [Agrobacterium tumefaciens]ASK41804.1 SIS domain-containing protein [Agrobacterium tumefaciens]NSZ87718.1 SIS domain-containing protein [Agrobacterium tumefaciens]